MSEHLIVAYQAGAENRILEWVQFRVIEGVGAFRVVMDDRPEAKLCLEALVARIEQMGATASGQVSPRPASRVLSCSLQAGRFGGVILAAELRRFGRLRRVVRKLQHRHQIGIVWVGPVQSQPLVRNDGHDEAEPSTLPRGDDAAHGRAGQRQGGEAA